YMAHTMRRKRSPEYARWRTASLRRSLVTQAPGAAEPMRTGVLDRRRAGVLLHLGSLEAGLGRSGRAFIDWLAGAGFTVWQMLPFGPTGPDGSPYWVRSDFAGNPSFIDSQELPDPGGFDSFANAARSWLEDFALFQVLSDRHAGAPWWEW